MPLHDWTDERGWDSVYPVWLTYQRSIRRAVPGLRRFLVLRTTDGTLFVDSWLGGRRLTDMPSHRLTHEGGPAGAKWLLEWDDATFTLKDPDSQLVFECPAAQAHRVIEVYELYAEGKVSFATPHGSLTFKKHRAAAAGLRLFVEAGLRADPE